LTALVAVSAFSFLTSVQMKQFSILKIRSVGIVEVTTHKAREETP